MTLKLDLVLNIDNDPKTSKAYAQLIRNTDRVNDIVSISSGTQAFKYLDSLRIANQPLPDIIFLSTTLPDISAWDFFDAYKTNFGEPLPNSIIMVSNSGDIKNLIKCAVHPEIQDVLIHPLTDVEVQRVVEEYSFFQRYQAHAPVPVAYYKRLF